MNLTPVGIDIAKAVFRVHYEDSTTSEIVNEPIGRAKFLESFANHASCLIGMDVWRRSALGTTVHEDGPSAKLMPAEFVKAFNIRSKNDAADTRATWLAVQQLGKGGCGQAVLALRRMRQQLVKFRTMQVNSLRGLLTEYGEVMGRGRAALDKAIPMVLRGSRSVCLPS